MILGGLAYLAGAAVSGGAVNVYMAILGRALLGVGLGFANQVATCRPRSTTYNRVQYNFLIRKLIVLIIVDTCTEANIVTLLMSGRATVPVRDGAGAIQGSVQQRLPVQPLFRRSRRDRRQIGRAHV